MEFCVNSVVAKVLTQYVQVPDHSAIRDEVEEYVDGYLSMRQRLGIDCSQFSKILFTTSECVIVEHLEMKWQKTRFTIQRINYEDWSKWFMEYLSPEHKRYLDAKYCDNNGARMYGARL